MLLFVVFGVFFLIIVMVLVGFVYVGLKLFSFEFGLMIVEFFLYYYEVFWLFV